MSITLIGAGNVGESLAHAFTQKGEHVVLGVPDPAKYATLAERLNNRARVTDVAHAIDANDIVILAVPYAATESIAKSRNDWQGKILVDATNPLAPGLAGLSLGTTTSGAEQIAQHARGARVVKAFNSTGAENMANSNYAQGRPFMPVRGDDADARARVIALVTLIGFDAVDMGDLKAARYLEPFAMTWIHLAIKIGYGRNFAFGLLRR